MIDYSIFLAFYLFHFCFIFYLHHKMEERLNKLEEQTKWLMQIHTTGFVLVLVALSTYLIFKNK